METLISNRGVSKGWENLEGHIMEKKAYAVINEQMAGAFV